jgi:hypothetical protein
MQIEVCLFRFPMAIYNILTMYLLVLSSWIISFAVPYNLYIILWRKYALIITTRYLAYQRILMS